LAGGRASDPSVSSTAGRTPGVRSSGPRVTAPLVPGPQSGRLPGSRTAGVGPDGPRVRGGRAVPRAHAGDPHIGRRADVCRSCRTTRCSRVAHLAAVLR
jgi:hypothetical protein